LLPACIDDYVATDALVRVVDAFVASLTSRCTYDLVWRK
jgi:hypothetical protein